MGNNQVIEIINNNIGIKANDKKIQKHFIWIDENINNEENKDYYDEIFQSKNIPCERFENVENGINYLFKEDFEFHEIIIIISGRLYNQFYYLFKEKLINIKFSPTIIVFLGSKGKFINNLKLNNIYYNNDLLNLIIDNKGERKEFINGKEKEEDDFSFEIIENNEQLIIPSYYYYLFEDTTVSEIKFFNEYLLKLGNDEILEEIKVDAEQLKRRENEFNTQNLKRKKKEELINKNRSNFIEDALIKIEDNKFEDLKELSQQLSNKMLPKEILVKYWIRIYTIECPLYGSLNKSLRKSDKNMFTFFPMIKLCYEGIKKNFLKPYSEILYRASKISCQEFLKYQTRFNKENDFPKLIVYSKTFLSFAKDKETANFFRGVKDKNIYQILYIIEKNEENIDKNFISNADIEEFNIKEEKEVLFFPLSCFEIVDIIKSDFEKNYYDYEIHLKCLGKYTDSIKKQLGDNFFDKYQITNFTKDLVNIGCIKKNIFPTWEIEAKLKIFKIKEICFFLDGKEKDFIGFIKSDIIVFSIILKKVKQIIKFNDEIIFLVKLKQNRICSTFKNNIINIIRFSDNNTKYEIVQIIYLMYNYTYQILSLKNDDFITINSNNMFNFYKLENQYYNYNGSIEEKDRIIKLKQINDEKIIYIKENNDKQKFIDFINPKYMTKGYNKIEINTKNKENQRIIDFLIFGNYALIGFEFSFDIINFENKSILSISLSFDDNFRMTNIINISEDRILLGLYNAKESKSYIRELILKQDNDQIKIDNYGEGKMKNQILKNIIKINQFQVLVNLGENFFYIFERKSEVTEMLKIKYREINKTYDNNNILDEKEEINPDLILIQNKINEIKEKERKIKISNFKIEKQNDINYDRQIEEERQREKETIEKEKERI